jgi:hypothetical protein
LAWLIPAADKACIQCHTVDLGSTLGRASGSISQLLLRRRISVRTEQHVKRSCDTTIRSTVGQLCILALILTTCHPARRCGSCFSTSYYSKLLSDEYAKKKSIGRVRCPITHDLNAKSLVHLMFQFYLCFLSNSAASLQGNTGIRRYFCTLPSCNTAFFKFF